MPPFRRIPFLRILTFLIAGILLQRYTNWDLLKGPFFLFLFITCTTFLVLFYRFWHRAYAWRWIPGLSVSAIFLLTGMLLIQHQTPQVTDSNISTKVAGNIAAVDSMGKDRLRIVLKPDAFGSDSLLRKKDKLLLMVQGPLVKTPKEGDWLIFKGVLRPLPGNSNPNSFNYGHYLKDNGFSAQAYLNPNDLILSSPQSFDYHTLPSKIRSKCLSIFRKSGISEPALVIVQALLLGDRSGMDREIQDSFIKSGAIHLLAVSGLHVGILYMLLSSFLSLFFKPSHIISILLSLGFLLAYAFLTGFSPSVSRAALMFAVIHVGRATNRNTNTYNSLAVSATLILIINPLFLFHIGFWLSHLAVLGILVFYPYINGLFTFRFIIWRHLWSLLAVSLAAQITTLPISLYTFGGFPTWFMLSNLLMLPLVAPILLLSIATLLFSFSPVLSSIFGGALNDLLLFLSQMAVAIEELPMGYLEHLWLSFPLVILCYLTIYQLARLCYRRNGKYWIGLTACLLVLTAGLNLQLHHKLKSKQIIVYDTSQGLLMDIIQKGQIFTIESEALNERTKTYARNAYIKQYRKHQQPERTLTLKSDTLPQILEIGLDSQCLIVANGNGTGTIVPSEAYKADMIVLSGSIDLDLRQLILKTDCHTIIATSACPYPLVEKWKRETANGQVYFHSIREQGAFISLNK